MTPLKFLVFGLECIALIALTGCAATTLYSGGKPIIRIQSNATNISYTGNGVTFHADTLDNSGPTIAGGQAFAQGASAVGSAATGVIVGLGSSGITKAAGAAVPVTSSILNRPLFSTP